MPRQSFWSASSPAASRAAGALHPAGANPSGAVPTSREQSAIATKKDRPMTRSAHGSPYWSISHTASRRPDHAADPGSGGEEP